MRIGEVDSIATHGSSALHAAVPGAKLGAFALVLGAVVLGNNVLLLLAILLLLLAVAVWARLPLGRMLPLALYSGMFAALFAFAIAPGWLGAALIVGKAITAAFAAVTLLFTTPYPFIFAPIQRWLPAVLSDALLMTYRSVFLMIDRFDQVLTAARLRAGLVGADPVRSAGVLARGLGGMLLYSVDLSQRTYEVMRLRGYDGRLAVHPPRSRRPAVDVALVLGGAAVLGASLSWRVGWRLLNPYSWAPVLLAALALMAAAAARRLRS
jgi:energy-coupling factor transporter transmembrane protein EcfT